MIVGLPKEIKNNEHRVGLTPDSVSEIAANGHEVFVENNCGKEIGFTNEKYEAAASYFSFVKPISFPQLFSTNTSCPFAAISETESGVNPTRCSLFLISFGNPTIILKVLVL